MADSIDKNDQQEQILNASDPLLHHVKFHDDNRTCLQQKNSSIIQDESSSTSRQGLCNECLINVFFSINKKYFIKMRNQVYTANCSFICIFPPDLDSLRTIKTNVRFNYMLFILFFFFL